MIVTVSWSSSNRRNDTADLKIYLGGLRLNGPDDPAIDSLYYPEGAFVQLTENRSRLADEIPFWYSLQESLDYWVIERVAPELAINLVSRFTDLYGIYVDERVQDIERDLLYYLRELNTWLLLS